MPRRENAAAARLAPPSAEAACGALEAAAGGAWVGAAFPEWAAEPMLAGLRQEAVRPAPCRLEDRAAPSLR